ncbi:hypothetical protein HPB50_010222 [Hyalomma asiaticum]|uniref:Uncharacterized protein n=1 Tax=Hyalomma asiaticum TaxID=266040 RepID=A0ACB7RNC2_HYAAI|nr:hypothetical protein HPB50_010222 [Hyalomma asiaticum]
MGVVTRDAIIGHQMTAKIQLRVYDTILKDLKIRVALFTTKGTVVPCIDEFGSCVYDVCRAPKGKVTMWTAKCPVKPGTYWHNLVFQVSPKLKKYIGERFTQKYSFCEHVVMHAWSPLNPHKNLRRERGRHLRTLQTHTFPLPTRLHLFYSDRHSPLCRSRGELRTVSHMIGGCDNSPLTPSKLHVSKVELRESALTSSSLDDQLGLVERAREAARAPGILD